MTQIYAEHYNEGPIELRIERFLETPLPKLELVGPKGHSASLIHGPYSEVHMERISGEPKGEFVIGGNGLICLHPETGQPLQIPFTREVGREALLKAFLSASSLHPQEVRDVVWREAHALCREPLVGDYQPKQLGQMQDGQSVNPGLFILATAMSISGRSEQKEETFVMHPDVLYFLSRGDFRQIPSTANHLENAFKALGMRSVYENVHFTNRNFAKVLPWMEDPFELSAILPKSAGICLDVVHLERKGWGEEKIAGAIVDLSRARSNLVVHVDSSYSTEGPGKVYLDQVYKLGIPVAYEQREH